MGAWGKEGGEGKEGARTLYFIPSSVPPAPLGRNTALQVYAYVNK